MKYLYYRGGQRRWSSFDDERVQLETRRSEGGKETQFGQGGRYWGKDMRDDVCPDIEYV